ncbi:DUF7019 family protein [Glycomyces algeriensis]|uniref:Uncharacterized protein n=1 Tax=Glycomyces algeriensis TaxID=256037 RepID=A0A9W6G9Z7_9ACTN|nr:SAVMC3_10250 family protein [Glycomyces algeriensis]MDA1364255.1 SAVMC3_10250 family protein [Glycomyces algeriensis]MDR7350283.1 hypothetical protein [Glycomyces algeriensis]GLI42992.1 hypothetical protein GALLR39Z86_28420 [Glycomyces algeriensis]
MSFKYYLYISGAKVDMMLPQFDPRPAGERHTELAFSLKVLSAKRSTTTNGGGNVARLERVLRHLQDNDMLGTVEEHSAFFWALMPMRWDIVQTEIGGRIAMFGGFLDEMTIALGGSSRHLIGWQETDGAASGSNTPALLQGIKTAAPLEEEQILEAVSDELHPELDAFTTVQRAVSRMTGPEQQLEFVAKTLIRDSHTILASPLYVALVD